MFAKYSNVFRSRWKALWWAAGILLTAYCSVPSPDEPAGGDLGAVAAAVAPAQGQATRHARAPADESATELAAVMAAVSGPPPAAPHARNPWAVDSPHK